MHIGQARIIVRNTEAARVAACAARISTTEGTALELFDKPVDAKKDQKLIGKVLASGHKSLMEHQCVSIAFNDVSVLVEQFIIEHRLASYTVKSRRYVNHSGAGYVVPRELSGVALEKYANGMNSLFALYDKLIGLGVPIEDARFVLPYSFRSNFYMTVNARELMRLIEEMRSGRVAAREELKTLGMQLASQFNEMYPGLLASEAELQKQCAACPQPTAYKAGQPTKGACELITGTREPAEALEKALEFGGRFKPDGGDYFTERNLLALTADARPRELEFVSATLAVKNISLSCLTHFTRHRIQSALIPDVDAALAKGDFVLPKSIADIAEAREAYIKAFADEAVLANGLKDSLSPESMAYLAMSGHVTDIMLSMNARELLHFMKLRTCARAQWEIRGVAKDMLEKLRAWCDDIFWAFGPSCLVDGRCPEGKLSCGKPQNRGGAL